MHLAVWNFLSTVYEQIHFPYYFFFNTPVIVCHWMQIALTLQGCAVIVLFGGSLLPTFLGDKKLLISI